MSDVKDGSPTTTSTVIVDRHARTLPIGRIALILAALIAIVAVAMAIYKQRQHAAPTPAAADAGQQPNVEKAIADLEAKLRANPNDKDGWQRLGWAYYNMQRFGDAANAYRRTTQIDPASAENWSALGEALTLAVPSSQPAAVPPEALAAFQRAIGIDPANPRARYFLAVKKDLDGDHSGAIDDWIKLLRESPAGAPWIGSVRDTVVQVAEKNKINVAGRLPAAPPAPTTQPGGAESVATAGIPGPTQQQMRDAASLPPGQQEAMVRGMVDSLANKLKANPRDVSGWIRLMRAHMVLGGTEAASQALRDGLAAFPSDQAARTQLTDGAKTLGVPGA